jgi:XRE family aerobic/anaerobic benzoate catabolism transcriptional regulator
LLLAHSIIARAAGDLIVLRFAGIIMLHDPAYLQINSTHPLMSSNIFPVASRPPASSQDEGAPDHADGRNPHLVRLGERVRNLRARQGMTRRAAAQAAGVSERHLANLEYGVGNASILILQQVAQALHCPVAELVGDETTSSTEWLMLRSLLSGRDEATLRAVREAAARLLGETAPGLARHRRIALIGLRGAGKTTLGQLLAEDLDCPFVELSREIENLAGCSTGEIQALYGQAAYRRYERRALEQLIKTYPEAVIATPGGLVSDPGSFNTLLSNCLTVWLQATPEDHMDRVIAQGDMRPMSASREAMDDLRSILAGRAAFYSKADLRIDTSAAPLIETDRALRQLIRQALAQAAHPHEGGNVHDIA